MVIPKQKHQQLLLFMRREKHPSLFITVLRRSRSVQHVYMCSLKLLYQQILQVKAVFRLQLMSLHTKSNLQFPVLRNCSRLVPIVRVVCKNFLRTAFIDKSILIYWSCDCPCGTSVPKSYLSETNLLLQPGHYRIYAGYICRIYIQHGSIKQLLTRFLLNPSLDSFKSAVIPIHCTLHI